MTDNELEQRLQAFYRAELPADVTAPAALRSRVATIPQASPVSRRPARHRGFTLLAAAALLTTTIVGGALLAGAGIDSNPSLRDLVAPSSSPSSSELAGPSAGPTASPVTSPAGVWIATGTMGTPRYDHAAVRLLDGRVLVVGCCGGGGGHNLNDLTSAELYDPDSGTWSATGSMAKPLARYVFSTATLLRDGKVLVRVADDADGAIVGAEVYDPASGTWTATGQMVRGADFVGDTATLLRDGKVLVAGLSGAQLYDPANGTWSATGKMTIPRYYAAATLLPDGRVLAAGGDVVPDRVVASAELYDPDTGSWTAIANMHAPLGALTATVLRDGKVLVAGWSDDGTHFEVEVYDPATGTWTALPARPGIAYRTATLLSDGRVLVTDAPFDSVGAELYDPSTGSWTTAAPMLRSHGYELGTPILLLDGTVLVTGGRDCPTGGGVCVATGSAELYVPAGVSPPQLPAFPSPPPPVFPSPTPIPTPYPPEAGPVPADARSWKVTVVNDSSAPATLFVAEDGENGFGQLCGSVTPNVVPAGVTEQVTFLLPAKNVTGCWIWVNAVPGQGSFFETSDPPLAGKFVIDEGGQAGWLSP